MSDNLYNDLDRPPLRENSLRRGLLEDQSLWRDLSVVRESASTNADLAASAKGDAAEGVVLVAEAQTAGRGRLDRSWASPPRAGLTFSMLLRPEFPAAGWGWLPLLAGVATASGLTRVAELDVRLKWPNDVIVGDRKLGGILTEAVGSAVVIGIGVNVSVREDELPVPTATSLAIEGSEALDRDPLLRAVLRDTAKWYAALGAADGDAEAAGLRTAYRDACATLGREVTVDLPGGQTVSGQATDVDAEGRLVVRTSSGERAVAAGDVVHVR
jgi:BirA family transcriptional regulator, biotin operon repressor / biotin---[acetyl-CoA-carboxylase] ligase